MGQSAWFQRSVNSSRPAITQDAPSPNGVNQNAHESNEEERREEEEEEEDEEEEETVFLLSSSSSSSDEDFDNSYVDISPIRQLLGLGRTLAEIDRASVSYNYFPPPPPPPPPPSAAAAAAAANASDEAPICSICFDTFKASERVRKLRCRHEFHSDCLVPWLRMRTTCPVCRRKISTGLWRWW